MCKGRLQQLNFPKKSWRSLIRIQPPRYIVGVAQWIEHQHPATQRGKRENSLLKRQCGKNSSDLSRGCSSGVERALCMREAEGSIPFISTNTYGTIWLVRRYFEHRRLLVQIQLCVKAHVAQLDSASGS